MSLKLGESYKFNSGFKVYQSNSSKKPIAFGNGDIKELELVDKPELLPLNDVRIEQEKKRKQK